MKTLRLISILFSVLFVFAAIAGAQPQIDGYFGLGTAQVASSNEYVDFLGTGELLSTSSMGGVFGTVGGGVMITPSLGVGAQASFHFTQADYAGMGMRPIFYDFNGIWMPQLSSRVKPEFQAGLGGLNLRFYGGGEYYNYSTGSYTDFAGSINHFQLHASAGLRFYITRNAFIRPQMDYHWVKGLYEFKSRSVPQYSLAIGYSFKP